MRPIVNQVLILALVFTSVAPVWALPTPMFRTVALSGQEAPGKGAVYHFFYAPLIDAAGGVMFTGILRGNVIDTGLWSERSGSLELVAREGNEAVGVPSGASFGNLDGVISLGFANYGSAGHPVFLNTMQSTNGAVNSSNDRGFWVERIGGLELMAREGFQAPGTPSGAVYTGGWSPLINSSGQVAFSGSLVQGAGGVDANNNTAIWSDRTGSVSLVVREGDIAPGTVGDTKFSGLGISGFNSSGHIAFSAGLTGADTNPANNEGIWAERGGPLELIVRNGDQAPGTPSGALFDLQSQVPVAFNSSSKIAFRSSLFNSPSAGVDDSNNLGIWSEGQGSLSLIARTGSQAPNSVAGLKFGTLSEPLLSDSGHVAFTASLTATGVPTLFSNTAIWSNTSGHLQTIAKGGEQAPGLPLGVTFQDQFRVVFPAVNSSGAVAFVAEHTGPGMRGAPRPNGLWAQDQADDLQLVVSTGGLFEVSPGDIRRISSVSVVNTFSGGGDGLPSWFSNDFKLAFQLVFTDGTRGIFTAMLTVPEPSAILLAALCAGIILAGPQRGPGHARSKLRGAALIERGASSSAK